MKLIQKSFLKPLLAVAGLMLFVSCGSQKPMVQDIQVKPHYVGNDLHLSLSADLGIGSVMLPQVSLPIIDPNSGENIGSVSMSSLVGGQNRLDVSVNVSAVANVQTQEVRLPNGGVLPLIGSNRTIVVPIDKKVELYISLSDANAAIGLSIPFKTLDSIGAKVGNVSMFPLFNMNQVIGAAGLYFSKNAGENGFGLFADVSQVLDQGMFKILGFSPDIQAQQELDYSSIQPSSSKEKRINRELYYLNRKKARLSLH